MTLLKWSWMTHVPCLLKVSSLTRVTSVKSMLTITYSVSQSVRSSVLERLVTLKNILTKSVNLGCSKQALIPLCCANRIFVGIPLPVLSSRLRREKGRWTRHSGPRRWKATKKCQNWHQPQNSPLHLVYWENDIFKRTFTPCKLYFVYFRTSPFLANIRAPKSNFSYFETPRGAKMIIIQGIADMQKV